MPDKGQVDGYSDNTTQESTATHGEKAGTPGIPDPGVAKGAPKPLDPEEYARLKKEAAEDTSDHDSKS